MNPHYVYRIYDTRERLIYVGCTSNLFGRLKAHQLNSWWVHMAARVKAKVYADSGAALAVERDAIDTEHPRWNLRGSWKHRARWSEQDYADYLRCYLQQRPQLTDYGVTHVQNVHKHFRARFGREIAS